MRRPVFVTLWACFAMMAEAGAQPSDNSYPGAGNYATPASPSANAIYEVLARLEQLQSEMQQLRGLVEEQAQTIADLERKQSNMYSDLDGRLQALNVTGQAVATPPAESAQSQPAAPVTAEAPATAASAEKPAAAEPAASAGKGSEKERYQAAYDTLRNGHNAQAVQMFEALVADFPAGEFSDNAQYWLGEAYKINRDYDKARAAFGRVVSQYPNSSKVPDALLKLGYIEFDQQNVAKARDYLTRVTTSYPGTTAAYLAAKKLAQMPQ